jgi:hypothetical protein
MGKYTVTNRSQMWGVGLVQMVLDFHTTCTFIHYKFSPLICLSYTKFGHSITADKHFDLLHGGVICQQRIVFNFLLTSSSKKLMTSSQHYNQLPIAYEVQVSLAILHVAIQSWRIFTCVMAGMVTVTF